MKHPLIYILLVSLLASCSSQSTDEPRDNAPKPILFGASRGDAISLDWANGRRVARDGENEIPATIPDDIGVFALGDGPNTTYVFRNQRVFWENGSLFNNQFEWKYDKGATPNLWPYTTTEGESLPRPWEKMQYRFFAYSPWHPTKDVAVTAENYSGFNAFIWDNVPGFTSHDYVLANNISDLDNRDETFTTYGNVVHFSMRHILARVRFFFRVSDAYRKIRKIEINSLTVLSAGKVKTATFNFKNDAWDEIVHWSNEVTGDAEPVRLVNTDEHYTLTTSYPTEPYTSVYVYPQAGFNEIKMTVEYSVYDSKDVKTRTASVTNVVSLPNWTLLSGYYYNIFINIAPDYLYVLSDNDQDFDGYVILKDAP